MIAVVQLELLGVKVVFAGDDVEKSWWVKDFGRKLARKRYPGPTATPAQPPLFTMLHILPIMLLAHPV